MDQKTPVDKSGESPRQRDRELSYVVSVLYRDVTVSNPE